MVRARRTKNTIKKVANGEIKTYPKKVNYNEVLEKAIKQIQPYIHELVGNSINSKWASLRLIDGDAKLLESMDNYLGFNLSKDQILNKKLEIVHLGFKKKKTLN